MRNSELHRNYLEDEQSDGFFRCLSLYVFHLIFVGDKICVSKLTFLFIILKLHSLLKSEKPGRHTVPGINTWFWILTPLCHRCQTPGSSGGGLSDWIPATYVGAWGKFSTLLTAGLWRAFGEVNQWMGALSLSL